MKRRIAISITCLLAAACGETSTESPSMEGSETDVVASGDAIDETSPIMGGATTESPEPELVDDGIAGSESVMQGDWIAREAWGVPAALFGSPRTEASLAVRCEGENLVFIRSARVDEGTATMNVGAGEVVRGLPAVASIDPLPSVRAKLAVSDELAATLANTVRPITVRIDDGPQMNVPASATLRRVVTECRRDVQSASGVPSPAASQAP